MCLLGINEVYLVDSVVIFSLSLMNRRPRAGHLNLNSAYDMFSKNNYVIVNLVSLTSVFGVGISF